MENISTETMSREQWLAERRKGIGGSDVAAILGINPWKSPHRIWVEKLGTAPDEPETEAMEMGKALEPVVADKWTRVTGRKLLVDNKIRICQANPLMIGSLDRIIPAIPEDPRGTGVLEIKTTSSYAFKSWEDAIPIEYYCQIQHYLGVTGWGWGEFGLLVDGRKFDRFPISADQEFIKRLQDELSSWWERHIVQGVEPALTGSETAKINALVGSTIRATPEILSLYNDFKAAKKAAKDAADKEKELKYKIQAFMQQNENLVLDTGEVLATYKNVHKDSFTVKESNTRQLRLKTLKGSEE